MRKPNVYCIVFLIAAARLSAAGQSEPGKTESSVVITDSRGTEVGMDRYAETFILFPREAVEILSITQSTEPMLGMSRLNQQNIEEMAVSRYFPGLMEVNTKVSQGSGYLPNLEEILKIGPDLVYQWIFGGSERWAPVEDAGIPVIVVGWGEWEDDLERYTLYADGLGLKERAEEVIAAQQKTAEDIKAVTSQIPRNERKNHVFITRIQGNEFGIWGRSMPHTPVHAVDNAAYTLGNITSALATVGAETLLEWDPDMIVLNTWDRPKLSVRQIREHPALGELTAVREGRVYESMTAGLLDNAPLTWIWYAALAYPDYFPDVDIRERIADDYRFLYGIDITEDDVDSTLNAAENRSSAGYGRFLRP